ncbi:MAG: response regulator, partial [Microcoleus sp. SIO2G3]|nr:response regulator [Microcoleus sp. SIO2G3]
LVESYPYDLVLLDVMLPKIDGISFCRRLRQRKSQVLVMLLTARDTTTDKLMGLDSGADDYVVKPFNVEELAARIRALLRRGSTSVAPVLVSGSLRLDPNTREVSYAGKPLQFSRKEYLLLELFLRQPQRVFSRREIVDQIWSLGEDPPDEDTVKSHIKNIRRELKAAGVQDLIETIYGQGYRLSANHLNESATTADRPIAPAPTLDAAVAEIWQRTKSVSFERVRFLEQTVELLRSSSLDESQRQKASQTAHKLAGSLGTFGFDEGSRIAHQLEVLFESEPERSQQPQIAPQAERLVTALSQELSGQRLTPIDEPPPTDQPLLLILDADRELAHSISAEAGTWKIRTAIATSLTAARTHLRQERPATVLLDPSFGQSEAALTALLSDLKAEPAVPLLIFSAQDRSIDRVAAVQLGGQLFLQKPMQPAQVLRSVTEVLQPPSQPIAHILAVDADEQLLVQLKTTLEPQGLQLTCLSDPTQFWEHLKAVQPDLLILDAALPTLSGIELCQSVRQDAQWNWLPIVFLIASNDASTMQQVFTAGADDCLLKPIAPEELSLRVLNRLKRSQLLRTQAETDVLTGIANRQQATQAFNQLLQLAPQSQQPMCLAVLDLDHFKQVNDKYGHLQGDRVLRQFAQFLKQKVRSGDVVARWGGEEFVVGMYGIDRAAGHERLAEILEEWRSLPLTTLSGELLFVTFSGGVAQYPNDGTALQMLYRTADAALYRAKLAGRDRILSVEGQPPALSTDSDWVDVLLVAPDDDLTHTILQALQTRGYQTHWLQSGKAAIARLKGKPPTLKARVVLLSEQLVDADCLDVLKRLGAKLLKQMLAIVLLTHPDLAESVKSIGAFDCVLTPFRTSVLMQRLRQILDG